MAEADQSLERGASQNQGKTSNVGSAKKLGTSEINALNNQMETER